MRFLVDIPSPLPLFLHTKICSCCYSKQEPWGRTICPERSGAEGKTKGPSPWRAQQQTGALGTDHLSAAKRSRREDKGPVPMAGGPANLSRKRSAPLSPQQRMSGRPFGSPAAIEKETSETSPCLPSSPETSPCLPKRRQVKRPPVSPTNSEKKQEIILK